MVNLKSSNISMVILPLQNDKDADLIAWIKTRIEEAAEAGSNYPAYDAAAELIQILREGVPA